MSNAEKITVCVPRLPSRATWCARYSLPSVMANGPGEILQNMGRGGPAQKRNSMARQASLPYVFFCDDDLILAADCLLQLLNALESDPRADFAYCDYQGIDLAGVHPMGPVWISRAAAWSNEKVRRGPYISACSLFRRDTFLQVGGFDESLPRLHDWDLFIRLGAEGARGVHVPVILFHAFYLPGASVTGSHDYKVARRDVMRKNGIA